MKQTFLDDIVIIHYSYYTFFSKLLFDQQTIVKSSKKGRTV